MERDDRDRLEKAYRADGADLWRSIRAFAGGSSDIADEAVAEAFAQAARRGSAVRDLRPWVYRAAFRIAAGELQRRRRQVEPLPDGWDRNADADESSGRLDEALLRLSPAQRSAFVLREAIGFSTAETAEFMGTTAVAVRVHVHAARRRLRDLYGLNEESDEDAAGARSNPQP